MSWRHLNIIWDDLTFPDSAKKFVMVALADMANDQGEAWPGITRISERTRLSRSTVKRCLRWLVSDGRIAKIITVGRGNTTRVKITPKTVHTDPFLADKTGHTDPNSEIKGVMVNDKRGHGAHKRGQALTHYPLDPSLNPQLGGAGVSPGPKIKNGTLTPQQLFWMINERLKTAHGTLKRKLETERDLCLAAASGINLTPEPPKATAPNLTLLPSPPTEEEWNAGIAALKSTVSDTCSALPNKQVLREFKFQRKNSPAA